MELVALDRLKKNPHRLIMGKTMHLLFSVIYYRILLILAGSKDIHESLDEFEFGQDLNVTGLHVATHERLKINFSTFSRLLLIRYILDL